MLMSSSSNMGSTDLQRDPATFISSLEVESTSVLLALSGPQQNILAELAAQSGTDVSLRGNTIHVSGSEQDVRVAQRFLSDAAALVGRGHEIHRNDVGRALRGLRENPEASLVDLLERSEERRVGKECRCRWSPYD